MQDGTVLYVVTQTVGVVSGLWGDRIYIFCCVFPSAIPRITAVAAACEKAGCQSQ